MKKILVFLTTLMFLLTFTSPTLAGWWIFGQGTDEIVTNYLYINQNSFDESGQEMTLFKEALKNGTIRINGKASIRNAVIAAVYVSLDNQGTWGKANLSKNGYFEYIFTPEIDKVYDVYIKIVDTTRKTNDVDSTYKKVKVINENIYDKVTESLNNLVQSYQNQDPAAFMKYISNNFAGDYAVLDFAIRKDFNAFDYIELRPFINNISRDNSGKVYVAIQYIRKVVASKSGQVYTDNGYTEFVFDNDAGVFKVFSMKNPLLFGLSDAGEVATGTIQNTGNAPILLVDNTGNVDAKPFRTAIDIIENDASLTESTIETETATLNDDQGFVFANKSYMGNTMGSDIGFLGGNSITFTGRGWAYRAPMGACNIDSVTEAPDSGYVNDVVFPIVTNNCYAVKNTDNKYAIIKITGYVEDDYLSFDYKFQPDGSRNF